MTRVLLTSTSFPENAQDWRGRFIADMTQSLARHTDIELSYWGPPGQLAPGVKAAMPAQDAAWLRSLLQRGGIAHLLRKRGPLALPVVFGLLRRLRRAYQESDAQAFHINWLQNALPAGSANKPMLITVLGSDLGWLRLPGMISLLRWTMRGKRVLLAPNADWMQPRLTRAFGDLADIRTIPFGIAEGWFAVERTYTPANRDWLAVTRLTPGKLGDLFDWGTGVFGPQRPLHLFGPRQDASISIPDWVIYHGPATPEALRHDWFPRAAGLITLSRHDEGRPQVMLEAMASGLPIVASNLPAHRDLIRHEQTGWLVDHPAALEAALSAAEDPAINRQIGQAAKAWVAEAVGTWDDCAERYHRAYQSLLEPARG